MTSFGSIVDRDASVNALVNGDAPVLPTLLPDPGAQVSSIAKGRRRLDDDDVSVIFDRWQKSMTEALEKARKLVKKLPNSMTARAQLADAALVANEMSEAVEAAASTLRMAQLRHGDESSLVDVPATYVALQVLIRAESPETAEQYLSQLPQAASIALLRASMLAKKNRLDEALEVLHPWTDADLSGVASFKGYLLVLQKRHAEAVRQLRLAHKLNVNDADVALNLAVALWHLGSPKKAIRWARYATRVAPGRFDAVMALLHYLVETRQFALAKSEIHSLADRGIVETPSYLVAQAQVAAGAGEGPRALAYLRRARVLSDQEGDREAVAELDGQIAVFRYMDDEIDRMETLQKIRSAVRVAPKSPLLVAMLADLTDTTSKAPEVRAALDKVDVLQDPSLVEGTRCRLAFLEGRFEEARDLATTWLDHDPNNERALRLWVFWYGALSEDWDGAARRALNVINRVGISKTLANAAAYALALAGRGTEALSILEKVVVSGDFVLMATKGLAQISVGEVEAGLRLYEKAANLADKDSFPHNRCFMTIHQAMGLRRLRVTETHHDLISAGALVPVGLPGNWEDLPNLKFLSVIARRRGWKWPVMID